MFKTEKIFDKSNEISEIIIENRKLRSLPLGNLYAYSNCSLLVTCCNSDGGLYLINLTKKSYSQVKLLDGDFRGIGKYNENYVIATDTQGIILLDNDFKVINSTNYNDAPDYHGLTIHNNNAYVVETRRNTIGIYNLPDLDRVDEIRMSMEENDVFHVNDLIIKDDNLFLSMFSNYGEWRKSSIYSGVIISFPLNNTEKPVVLQRNLKYPHSIVVQGNNLLYCNSANFEVKENNQVIYKGTGFTRGLALKSDMIYIGQSESRNVEDVRNDNNNISLDCGVIAFNRKERISKFIPLPSEEVYGIMVLDETED